jgi:simple sugar transport system permease protein
MKKIAKEILLPISSIFLAFLVGAVIIKASGRSPFLAYQSLLMGGFGSLGNLAQTCLFSIPLIFTGLSVALAYKCGLFNIGGEGQFLLGGLFAMAAAIYIHAPFIIHFPLCLLCGFAGGAVAGAIPGWLKARYGIHEVINTIMLNWICLNFVTYIVNGPMRSHSGLGTPEPLKTAVPPLIIPDSLIPGNQLNIGFIIAIIFVLLVGFYLSRTVQGYELKAVGLNPMAAEYGGISISKNIFLALCLAGGLSGLGGTFYYLGDLGRIPSTLSFPGYGFEGIAVALVGKLDPLGVFLASLLFGALESGGIFMQLNANVPKDLVTIIQGLVIIFVIAPGLVQSVFNWYRGKKEREGFEYS